MGAAAGIGITTYLQQQGECLHRARVAEICILDANKHPISIVSIDGI